MAAIIIIFVVVFFTASIILESKIFPDLYAKTSINPFGLLHKILCAVIGLSFYLCIPVDGEIGLVPVGIIAEVISIGLLVLLNLKYKSPAQIAKVTALQFVYGLGFSVKFFFWVIEVSAYFANIVLGKGSGSGSAPQLFRSVGVVGKIEDELENSRRISRENAEEAEERRIEAEKAYKEKNG